MMLERILREEHLSPDLADTILQDTIRRFGNNPPPVRSALRAYLHSQNYHELSEIQLRIAELDHQMVRLFIDAEQEMDREYYDDIPYLQNSALL